jgi:hypothetical protein
MSAQAAPADAPAAFDSSEVVDEASAAAAGTRAAARWLASALGGIPSLAIVGAVVRSPGDGGFEPWKLALGVAFAALGAVIGVLAFARVLAPVPLEDKDLLKPDFDLKRIPGQPYTRYSELTKDMDAIRRAAGDRDWEAADALRAAKQAEAEAQIADADAKEAEAAAAADPQRKPQADGARRSAQVKQHELAAKSAQATAIGSAATIWAQQYKRRDAVRSDAYRLLASDTVGKRYSDAKGAAVLAVALIAAGVVLIGLAPKPKPAASKVSARPAAVATPKGK